MAMSKKDYQALARAINTASAEMGVREGVAQSGPPLVRAIVSHVADVLAADNPRFDRARFIEACETGSTKGMPLVPVSENAPGRTVLDR